MCAEKDQDADIQARPLKNAQVLHVVIVTTGHSSIHTFDVVEYSVGKVEVLLEQVNTATLIRYVTPD